MKAQRRCQNTHHFRMKKPKQLMGQIKQGIQMKCHEYQGWSSEVYSLTGKPIPPRTNRKALASAKARRHW
jgi:hypothetical protein